MIEDKRGEQPPGMRAMTGAELEALNKALEPMMFTGNKLATKNPLKSPQNSVRRQAPLRS